MNRSSFWAACRKAAPALVLFSMLALLIGCGGGGGGGGGNGGPGGGTGTIPNAPTNLTATPGNGQITLNWTASAGATSYNIKRATLLAGPYTTILNGHPTTSLVDGGRNNGTTYYYKVSATNVNGTSGDSNIASATPTAGGGGGLSWLPVDTIFYRKADDADPTATDIRKVNPNGTGDALFALMPPQISAVSANPNVTNQYVFAYTTDTTITSATTYALYKNSSVNVVGATPLTPSLYRQVGSILFTLDGQKIYFTADDGVGHNLYSMNPDGGSRAQVTAADDASLSPDGSKILISQNQGGQDDLFYVQVSDNSLHPVLATVSQDEIMPQWSKDGLKVVFSAQTVGDLTPNFEVFVVNFGSSSPVQLTANGDDNLSPSVSADNTQVAYARLSFANIANSGLYRAPIGGGGQTNILLSTSIGSNVYWTSSTGRSTGGIPLTMGRSLREIHR